jgi:hypothetical protein
MSRSILGLRVGLAGLLGTVASGCTVATVGEGTEVSRAELVSAAAIDAGGPIACGARFVSPSGDAAPRNTCRSLSRPCRSINQAVAVACPADIVLVGAGTFAENVVVDKPLSFLGAGENTVIVPATSSPDPCRDSSLCGGAASSVFLVRASDVTLASLVVDGDNPALTSGLVVRGADVDARNGIITDTVGTFDRLEVRDVTVRNVYLRGIEASSGGTFVIENNRVRNLSDADQAVAIYNSGGAGRIEGNLIADSRAGIAANESRGMHVALNAVVRSGAGVHTDNQGIWGGSTPDVIEENVVSDCTRGGYGLWSFAPVLPVTFRKNRVSRCDVGLADFGQGAPVESVFIENHVDAGSRKDSVGLYVTTSMLEYGSATVSVLATQNTFENASIGVLVEQQPGFVATASLDGNALLGDTEGLVSDSTSTTADDGGPAKIPLTQR